MNAKDETHLRRAIALAAEAVAKGSRPFGAVVVSAAGKVVAEANAVATTDIRDWTAHSEMAALRKASEKLDWAELEGCTLYASGEPCPMCASALYWCNIRRLVYGAGEPAIRALRLPFERAAGIEIGCREIFAHCPHEIEAIGPCLEEEALVPHRDFWPNAPENA